MLNLNIYFVAAIPTLVIVSHIFPVLAQNTASKFAESIQNVNASATCKRAIRRLDHASPRLNSCYRNSGLYFSTPDVVCSPGCLEPTIQASKELDKSCTGSNTTQVLSSPDSIYKKWSCEGTVRAACSKDKNGVYCLRAISSKSVLADEIRLDATNATMSELQARLECDSVCAKPLYEALDGNGDKAPVLYYFGYSHLRTLFSAYEKVCGFRNSTVLAATKNGTAANGKASNTVAVAGGSNTPVAKNTPASGNSASNGVAASSSSGSPTTNVPNSVSNVNKY